jgi:hypothetical protein
MMKPSTVVQLLVVSISVFSCCRASSVQPKAAIAETPLRTQTVCAPSKPPSEPETAAAPTNAKEAAKPPPGSETATPPIAADAPPPSIGEACVAHFDCTSTLEDKRGLSLRRWNSGGPNGAGWNIDGGALLCTISIKSPCAGRAVLRIFGQKMELAKRTSPLIEGDNEIEVRLPFPKWERAVDLGETHYTTHLLSLGGLVFCGEGPSEQYPFADAFLMGHASGE